MKLIRSFVLLAAIVFCVPFKVDASGFALVEQNASGLGNSFAGAAASAEDASTVFFNPAGMTYLQDNQLVLASHAIKPTGTFSNQGSQTISAAGTPVALQGGNGGDVGSWQWVPNVYFAKAVTDRWRMGIGVNSPYGLKTQYDANWVGRYQALTSDLTTININPSIAFKVNDYFSIGAGVDYQYAQATLSNALDLGTICYGVVGPATCGSQGLTPQTVDGNVNVQGSDWSWGYNLGVIFQPVKSVRFGVAYRSGIHHQLKGNANFSHIPAMLSPVLTSGSVSANLDLPDTLSSSIAYQANEHWEFLADTTWTNWSSFKQLSIMRTNGASLSNQPENWANTFRYSLGASYKYTHNLKIRVGMAYDESPVSTVFRTARIPDNNRIWLSSGINYKFSPNSHLDIGYAHIFIDNTSINQGSIGSAVGLLSGQYSNNINIVSLQFSQAF